MVLLSKQKGLIPIVLALFVGVGSFIAGVVAVKATDNHSKQESAQVQSAPDSDVGVK